MDISKNLVARIRDILDDHDKKIVRNDNLIYQYLTGLQDEFMRFYDTTKANYEIPITSDTKYDIDPRVNKIYDLYEKDDNALFYKIDKRQIVLVEGQTGTIVYDAFIVPATHVVEGIGGLPDITVSDDITSIYDPIIGTQYHKYLIEGVVAMLATKDMRVKSLQLVHESVQMTAIKSQGENRVYGHKRRKNIFGVIQI